MAHVGDLLGQLTSGGGTAPDAARAGPAERDEERRGAPALELGGDPAGACSQAPVGRGPGPGQLDRSPSPSPRRPRNTRTRMTAATAIGSRAYHSAPMARQAPATTARPMRPPTARPRARCRASGSWAPDGVTPASCAVPPGSNPSRRRRRADPAAPLSVASARPPHRTAVTRTSPPRAADGGAGARGEPEPGVLRRTRPRGAGRAPRWQRRGTWVRDIGATRVVPTTWASSDVRCGPGGPSPRGPAHPQRESDEPVRHAR